MNSEKLKAASEYAGRINYTLYEISNAVNTTHNLEELYQSIYDSLNRLMPLPNFFIALYNHENKTINFEFFIDEYDDDFPIIDTLEGPSTLTGEVISTGQPLFLKENKLKQRAKQKKLTGTVSKVWIGIPLIIQDHVIGVLSVQHYEDPEYFSHHHLEILVSVSDQIAMAIERKQILDDLEKKGKTLNLIMENMGSILAIINSAGLYEFANPAHKLLGYDGRTLTGTSFFDIVHPDDIKKLMEFFKKGIENHIFHVFMELRLRNSEGQYVPMSGTFDLIMNADGMMEKAIFISKYTDSDNTCKVPEGSDMDINRLADLLHKRVKSLVTAIEAGSEPISEKNQTRIVQTIASLRQSLRILEHSKLRNAKLLKSKSSEHHGIRCKVPAGNRKKTVLIIEDEDMVRDVASNALKTFGYTTMEAGDGEMGVNIYKQNHMYIDVVLLDIIIPKLSGTETFKQIRKINPGARIIVTSGHITNQDQQKMFAGAAAYLDKPYQIMQLKKVVESVLDE